MRHAMSSPGSLPAIPITIPMPVVTITDDLIVVPFTVAADLLSSGAAVSGWLNALVAGTLAVNLVNNAAGLLATLTWTAAGLPTVSNRNVNTIGAGDSIHLNATSIGTSPVGLSITIWVRPRG